MVYIIGKYNRKSRVRSYLILKEVLILHDSHLVRLGAHFIFQHFFMNRVMRIRVKVIIFACTSVHILFLFRLVIVVVVVVVGFVLVAGGTLGDEAARAFVTPVRGRASTDLARAIGTDHADACAVGAELALVPFADRHNPPSAANRSAAR